MFLAQQKVTVLDHPPYSPDLAPADYVSFRKVKSHLKGRLFDAISDIQKAVTSTLTLKVLMSYIYGAPILDVSRLHTTTQHSR